MAEGVEFALRASTSERTSTRSSCARARRGRARHRRAAAPRPRRCPAASSPASTSRWTTWSQRNRARRRPARAPAPSSCATGLRVAILGGGDTSADCLGNALREGCASVVEIAHGADAAARARPAADVAASGRACCVTTRRTRRAAIAAMALRDRRVRGATAASPGCAAGRQHDRRRPGADRDRVHRRRGRPRCTRASSVRIEDGRVRGTPHGRVRGRRLRPRRRPDRHRDRRRPASARGPSTGGWPPAPPSPQAHPGVSRRFRRRAAYRRGGQAARPAARAHRSCNGRRTARGRSPGGSFARPGTSPGPRRSARRR